MLELNPDIVRAVIASARAFQAKEEVSFPEEPFSPTDDWAMQILADHGNDLSLQEVRSLIDDLEPDQQVALVALMWVGRGDFGAGEWDEAYEQAKGSWTVRTADYLMSTPMVANYLEEGLAELGYDIESER